MKRYINTLLILVLASVLANAKDIDCEAGGLAKALAGTSETNLRINGSINAIDLFYLADNLPGLKTLDLSGCTIAAYSGAPVKGASEYAASTIPVACFAGTGLESIILPTDGTTIIADGAFASTKLANLTISSGCTIGSGAFAACDNLESITITAKCTIDDYAFRNCPALATANLEGVTIIGNKAFANCKILSNVKFGSKLTTILDSAFEGCDLRSVALGNTTVYTIGAWTFARNPKLASVVMSPKTIDMGNGVFADCPLLTEFSVPAPCVDLPDYAFKDTNLSTLSLGEVETIGAYAFKGNSELRTLDLPSTLEYIGDNAMEGMTGLANINGRELTAVPQLGKDVWEGIDQGRVLLIVKSARVSEFRDAPQWQDFRIIDEQTGNAETEVTANDLRGYIASGILKLQSSGSDIATVEVYDIGGLQVAICHPDTTECDVDLTQSSARIYIVRVALADGSVYNLKLAR